jgi:hypothetical protein
MKQPYELSIALRYLRARSGRGFISFISAVSMIGIGLAVAVLIVVLSVMNGFEHELQQRILGMVSDASIVGYDAPLEDWPALRARALQRSGIDAAAPFVEGQAMVVAGEALAGVTVRGVDPTLEHEVSNITQVITEGSIEALEPNGYNMLIGSILAEVLGVGIGGEVVLVLAEGRVTPAGLVPRIRSFTVAGIFEAGMYEYDRGLVFVNFDDASRLFRTAGRATGLRLDVADLYTAGQVATAFATELANELGTNFYIDDWTRQHDLVFGHRCSRLQYRFDVDDGGSRQARGYRDPAQLRFDAALDHDDLRQPRNADRPDRDTARSCARASRYLAARQSRRFARRLVRCRPIVGRRVLSERLAYAVAAVGDCADLRPRLGPRNCGNLLSRIERGASAAGGGVAI